MNKVTSRLKPTVGFSHFFHYFLSVLLPVVAYILVRISLPQLAFTVVLLSKWRILAVKPRHWLTLVKANSVDIIIGLSVIAFMVDTDSTNAQLVWTFVYAVWLILLKPRSSTLFVSLQAAIGQALGLIAVVRFFGGYELYAVLPMIWLVSYSSARHFLTSFDEPLFSLLSNMWGYFAACLGWITWHWLTYYGVIPQVAVVLSVIGYTFAIMYYFDYNDRLTKSVLRQCLLALAAFLSIILVFWVSAI